MRNLFLLLLIGALFAFGSYEDLVSPQQLEPDQNNITSTQSFLGQDICFDTYIGERLEPDQHQALALSPNYQERTETEQKPILFQRSDVLRTDIVDIRINSRYAKVNSDKVVASWDKRFRSQDYEQLLNELTLKMIATDSNVLAAKYKVVPIDDNTFTLEDVQIIYRTGYEIEDFQISFRSQDDSTSKKLTFDSKA